MLREKGCFRMSLSVSGISREDCIKQILREFAPVPPKSVSKLDVVRVVRNAPGFSGGLMDAKLYVEQELPQLG